MFDVKKYILVACVIMGGPAAMAADLSGVASVNVTSTTAAAAKNMAMDEARRQIISDSLGQYADRAQLAAAIKAASGADLNTLIAATGIDGEKLSDTTYSADISMTLDGAAAKKWMAENNVQNWLTDGASGDNFITVASLSDAMADWMALNQIARDLNLNFGAKSIMGRTVTIELPVAKRAAFTAAVRGAGWNYSDNDGTLRIWK